MTPEVPAVTPVNPGQDTPVVYHKDETPTPKTVTVTPETPKPVVVTPEAPKTVDATPVTPQVAPVKHQLTPQADDAKAPELPQTGEKQNNVVTTVGAAIVTGLLGILAFAKKKKDDQKF